MIISEIKTKDFTSGIRNLGEIKRHQQHNIRSIFLVLFGSFILGAIPIIYGLRLTTESSQNAAGKVPVEMSLWRVLGER